MYTFPLTWEPYTSVNTPRYPIPALLLVKMSYYENGWDTLQFKVFHTSRWAIQLGHSRSSNSNFSYIWAFLDMQHIHSFLEMKSFLMFCMPPHIPVRWIVGLTDVLFYLYIMCNHGAVRYVYIYYVGLWACMCVLDFDFCSVNECLENPFTL